MKKIANITRKKPRIAIEVANIMSSLCPKKILSFLIYIILKNKKKRATSQKLLYKFKHDNIECKKTKETEMF